MPLPVRLPPKELHPLDSVSPLEGTIMVVAFYITAMALVYIFTKKKKGEG